jgi:tetratricopeptide (TPR) repeat protein
MTAPNADSSLHVLLLLSSPLDSGPVDLHGALAHLEQALRAVQAPAQFHARVAEPDAVAGLLARGDRPLFPVLHYLGHGFKPDDVQQGYLIFENRTGGMSPLSNLHLRAVLNPANRSQPEFQVAVLTACHSASMAPALQTLGVRHIVAVDADETVYEVAAVAFFRRFYQALLTGTTVREAFDAGRNAVLLDETLGRLGPTAAMHEAGKFQLLPEGASHDQTLATPGNAAGPVELAPLPSLSPPSFVQVPPSFVGRSDDLRAVLQVLHGQRAVLIQGVSGVGKTLLAWETARWLVARRQVAPERVHFLSLVNADNADQARSAIALALGLSPGALPLDPAAANQVLANSVAPGSLLVLDEAENMIRSGGRAVRDLFDALAQGGGRPLLIVTSQSDVGSSHLKRYLLQRLTPSDARLLFARAAQVSQAEWEQLNQTHLAELLDYVDRLPRAIELTARQWRYRGSLDLRPLLADLRRYRDEIMHDPRYPDEVKSVSVGIRLAYERLRSRHPAAAEFYPLLSLFPAGLPDNGVTAIFGPDKRSLLPLIQDESLLERPVSDLVYLPTPFRFFAERQLPDGLAAAQAQWGEASLRFYYDFADEEHLGWAAMWDKLLRGAGDAVGAVIARYALELPSIETWLDWAYQHEPCSAGRSRSARLTYLLRNIYAVTGLLREQGERYARALAAAQRCQDRLGAANTRLALGDLALRQDDLAAAGEQYRAALADFQAIGERLGAANTRQALGDLALRQDDLAAAGEQYRAALADFQAIGERLGAANTRKVLGDLALRQDDLAAAGEQYRAALADFQAIGDRLGAANTRKALGDLALRQADLAAAGEQYRAALADFQTIGERLGAANTRQALGDLALRQDDLAAAGEQYRAALADFQAIGERLGAANTRQALGDLALRQDDLAAAGEQYRVALADFQAIGERLGAANTRKALGDLALRQDDLAAAGEQYRVALADFQAIGERLGAANTRRSLGDLALRQDDLAAAGEQYRAALADFQAIGERLGAANTRKALGDLALRQDDLAAAGEQYRAALADFQAIGSRLGAANTRRSLGDLALRQDDLAAAGEQYRAALADFQAIGSRLGAANTRLALGDLALRQADLAAAGEQYRAALADFQAIGSRLGAANTRKALGDLALLDGNPEQAVTSINEAIEAYRQIGSRLGEAGAYVSLGRATDDPNAFERAIAIHTDIQSACDVAVDSYYYGLSMIKLGNPAKATGLLTTASDIWQRIGLLQYAQAAQQVLQQLSG